MWWIKTVFVGLVNENGNWSATGHDTEEEAQSWWNAAPGKASYPREQTLTDPQGTVVEARTVNWNGTVESKLERHD